ncbi:MAG: DUF4127 family protein [Clostridiales bacterium]|nr:DUF4127 family protein [Clostridiales bacterium]
MTRVLYIPLDERACNYDFPLQLAEISGDIELMVPPRAKMGFKKSPADVAWLWEWIFHEAGSCEYAILSVDTLIYGNIINSRIHQLTQRECLERLENFSKLKRLFPQLKMHAFNLVARVAGYNSSQEDPDYWATQGRNIWRYTILMDKAKRNSATKQEEAEKETLEELIPGEHLADFLNRRATDRLINLGSVDLVCDGVFDILTIPKDDTAEYGYAAMDQAAIAHKVKKHKLMDRVMVYPGADEVGSVLFARIFNLIHKYTPRVYIRYSSVQGPFIVPKYEDRLLEESIKSQITSMGGILEDQAAQSDCMLAVNSPGTHMIESYEQRCKDLSFSTHINMHEFIRYIGYYAAAYENPIGLAEVSVCNGCENEFSLYACITGTLDKVSSFGGWNTAQNTIGLVLAQTVIASYFKDQPENELRQKLMEEFTISSIVRDWLYQSNVLHKFLLETENRIDPYLMGGFYDETVEYFKVNIQKLMTEYSPQGYKGKKMILDELCFDWDGVFYIRLKVSLQSA